MVIFRFYLLFVLLLGASVTAFATTGCRGISTGDLYTVSTADPLGPNGTVWLFSSAVKNPQNSFCIKATTSPCTVRNGTQYFPGAFLVDYVPIVNCPLDTDIWVLFIATAGLGICLLRSKVG